MTADELAARLATLEHAFTARVAELEDRVADLAEQLRIRRRGSMRDLHRCPACGHGELLHIPRATQVSDMGIHPLALVHDLTWRGHKFKGPLEVYVCRACKLVEPHAIDLVDLDVDGVHVVEITAPAAAEGPPAGPYR